MQEAGYVYILINQSAPDILKIGKTQRDPEERAKELSAATGVPTPFYVAFQSYFDDCSWAEEFVHTRLASKRVANNREFFKAKLNDAINVVLEAERVYKSSFPKTDSTTGKDNSYDKPTPDESEPWRVYFELAEDSYYGRGDTLQDVIEAVRFYKQAAKLGSSVAYFRLGCIYRDDEKLRDTQQALKFLAESASRGVANGYVEMTKIYVDQKHFDNALKCWTKYFESDAFVHDTLNRGWNGCTYLIQVKQDEMPLKNKSELLSIRDEILQEGQALLMAIKNEGGDPTPAEGLIHFIYYILYPEIPRKLHKGTVSVVLADNSGRIRIDGRTEIWFFQTR